MGRPEHHVEGYLIDQCRSRGWWTAKFTSPGLRGVPDQVVITPACTCFIETKSETGTLRRQQVRTIALMQRAGGRVYTARSRAEVDTIIAELESLNARSSSH